METKHTLTKLEEELISILIETFKNHGWTIDELPAIFDSDEKPNELTTNTELLDIEKYLGIYRVKDKCFKGEVVLYHENIKDLSHRYFYEFEMRGKEIDGKRIFIFLTSDDYLISENEIFDYLKSIVLIHELTHWMIHWNSDFNQKSLKCEDKYESADEINFHEGLAQYFTDCVIRKYGNKKMLDVFDRLNLKQSRTYKVFVELKTDLDGNPIDVACVFIALALCWEKDYNQSFELLEKYNYISVLYYSNDIRITFEEIKAKKPALDQERITRWYKIGLFEIDLLAVYFSEENKFKYRGEILGKKFGL
jgi:hypothetical protein